MCPPPTDRRGCWSSAGAVDVGSVVDAVDDHDGLVVENFVDDAVGAAAGRVKAGEFTLEPTTDSMRVLDESTEHELDNGCGGSLGEPLELSLRWPRYSQPKGRQRIGHEGK
jgi:hypothetical protein